MSESPINRAGIGNEEAAKRVVEAFVKNTDGLTPEKCREALSGSVIDQKGFEALKGALSDGYVTKDERAKLLEAGFSGRFVYALTDEANTGRNAIKRRAESLGNSASEKWYRRSPSFETRYKAVDQLLAMRSHSPESTRELLKVLDDMQTNPKSKDAAGLSILRTNIVGSLLEKGDGAIPSLTAAMRDGDHRVQRQAASLLGSLQSERATRALMKRLPGSDMDLGDTIMTELCRMNPSTVARMLQEKGNERLVRNIKQYAETEQSVPAQRLLQLLRNSATSESQGA